MKHKGMLKLWTPPKKYQASRLQALRKCFHIANLAREDTISPFSTPAPGDHLPYGLQPTAIQKTIRHYPAYDVFPDVQLREQIILSEAGSYDVDALCLDLVGWLSSEPEPNNGLLVWGEPYLIENWEAGESFLRRYRRLVRGCKTLLDSSNRWRTRRGEPQLRIEESS